MAKTIDIQSGFRARSSLQTDPLDINLDRGLADFDATHRLVLSGSWEIPWDRPFRDHHFMRKLTEGWQINGIASFQSGTPFTIFSNDNQSQQGSGLDRADLVGKIQTFNARKIQTFTPDPNGINGSCLNGATTGNFYFNPLAYDCANVTEGGGIPLFSFGDSGRNTVRGPGINNVDLSIIQDFQIQRAECAGISYRDVQRFQSHPVPAGGQFVLGLRIYGNLRAGDAGARSAHYSVRAEAVFLRRM